MCKSLSVINDYNTTRKLNSKRFFSWYINILGRQEARNNFTIKWQKNIEIKPGEQNLDVIWEIYNWENSMKWYSVTKLVLERAEWSSFRREVVLTLLPASELSVLWKVVIHRYIHIATALIFLFFLLSFLFLLFLLREYQPNDLLRVREEMTTRSGKWASVLGTTEWWGFSFTVSREWPFIPAF